MLDKRGDLAIAVLAFYIIGLPVSVFVCFRHGFGRQLGWMYLILLPVARIIGSALTIAAENVTPLNVGLYTGAAIMNSIGLVPLLLCLMGLLKRVNDGQRETSLNDQFFRLTHLVLITGLALSIAGGTLSSPDNTASTISTGLTLRKAAAILLLVAWVVTLAMNALFMRRLRYVWEGDKPLLFFGLAAEPFILVRIIYLILTAFDSHSKLFNPFAPNIYVQAFMQVTMEFIAFILFVIAGVITPGIKNTPSHPNNQAAALPSRQQKYAQNGQGDAELGTIPARQY